MKLCEYNGVASAPEQRIVCFSFFGYESEIRFRMFKYDMALTDYSLHTHKNYTGSFYCLFGMLIKCLDNTWAFYACIFWLVFMVFLLFNFLFGFAYVSAWPISAAYEMHFRIRYVSLSLLRCCFWASLIECFYICW